MQRRVHILVTGRVQGVGFRAYTRDKALTLGINGWVRNVSISNGAVEILAEGDKLSMSAFIDWCETGPRWASVDKLTVIDETPKGEFTSFAVLRDQ